MSNPIPKPVSEPKGEKPEQIVFKREWHTGRVELKPNTFYWRLRYWLNQYTALVCTWLIKPVAHLNHATFRVKEGESFSWEEMNFRAGMLVQEPDNLIRLELPAWVKKSKYFKQIFEHFREILWTLKNR